MQLQSSSTPPERAEKTAPPPPSPQWNPPPAAPQWSPPPPPPSGWMGPAYGGLPPRPAGVTFAGGYLIVTGVLISLLGLLTLAVSGSPIFLDNQRVIAAITGVLELILGIGSVAAGVGALGRRTWARWAGVIVCAAVIVYISMVLLINIGNLLSTGSVLALAVPGMVAVLYVFSAAALISARPWFAGLQN